MSGTSQTTMELYLLGRIEWIVRLRWFAVAAVVGTSAAAALLDILAAPHLLLIGAVLLVLGNLAVARTLRVAGPTPALRFYEGLVFAQILIDLGVLTLLLQLSGGPENPFSMLYVFLAALAGMLLPLRLALFAGAASCVFHGAGVLGELAGILPHVPLAIGHHHEADVLGGGSLWSSPLFASTYVVAFAATQLGVIWFFHQVVERYRDAEERRRRQEVIAVSRERLARVGTLAAGVAHTVRNPLHGLMNGLEIVRRSVSADDHDAAELLDAMQEGIDRIARMTSRLLTLTRSDTLRPEPTDVSALVEDALRFVKLRSHELGVHLEVDLRHEATALIDVAALSEALANVVDNAVYASRGGGSVAVRVLSAGAGRVAIEVSDTGAGIDEAALSQVFDPFFTTKPIGEGTGLGLAIAQRAVEDHGGTIGIRSGVGEGTQVIIELPTEGVT